MKVSILLATKDRMNWVWKAMQSVFRQDDDRWELVILDNGTPMAHLVPEDPRIVYKHSTASGSADAFNQALQLATGDICIPLGDDDELAPQTVRTILNRIREYDWGYALTAYVRDGETLCLLGATWDIERFRRTYYLGGAVFWRRSLSDRVGGFDPAWDLVGDYDLYLRFAAVAEPVFVDDEVLYIYHDHPLADTRVHAAEQQAKAAAIASRTYP